MRNILLTTVTALLLASCGVYKPYSRPEEVKTDGLYGTDIQAEDTASIAGKSSVSCPLKPSDSAPLC